jgi:N-acetylglucosaminyldiphosphoundecaprenol N-acetyl-beta-D-mannosaminyltransferase
MTTSAVTTLDKFHPVTAEFSLSNSAVGAPIAIMGVPFDNVTRSETLNVIHRMVQSRSPHYIATANVDFLVKAQTDVELRRILFDAHLVLCDGTPLLWASRWLGNPLPERVAGSDLVPVLLEAASAKGYRIFILGAAEGMNRMAAENIQRAHPDLLVVGRYSPPPTTLQEMDHDEIKRQIGLAKPDILLVAFGCPKQEKWISMNYRELGVPVCVGVGATVDFLAGAVKRAPLWMRRAGLEWTWRLAQEPRRLFGRYAKDLVVFGAGIVRQLWNTRTMKQVEHHDSMQTLTVDADAQILVMPERLDAAAVRESRDHWEGQAKGGMMIVDLGATKFIDSTGVGFLMRLRRLARETSAAFALASVAPTVWRSIELMKLGDFFPVGANVDEAWQVANDGREQLHFARPTADGVALQLQGELTESTVDEAFKNCVAMLADLTTGKKVTLDLSHVSFMDSAGIAVLVRLRKVVRAASLEMEIVKPSPAVTNTLQMSGLAALLLNGSACKSE